MSRKIRSPMAAKKQPQFSTFASLARANDRGIQCVLREVERMELALALKGTPGKLRSVFLRNMSSRAQTLIQEHMEYIGPVRRQSIEEARRHILDVANRLYVAGEICYMKKTADSSQGDEIDRLLAEAIGTVGDAGGQQEESLKRRNEWDEAIRGVVVHLGKTLKEKPIQRRSSAEVTCILVDLAELARRAGILMLESVTEMIDEPFLVKGIQLAVDGRRRCRQSRT